MRLLYRVVKDREQSEAAQGAFDYPDFAMQLDAVDKRSKGTQVNKEPSVMEESLTKAEEILDTAREEAERIKEQAYEEGYTTGKDEGYDAGMQHGIEEGTQKYSEQLKDLQRKIEIYVRDVEIEKAKILEKYLDDLKEIALAIGEKIVRTSLRSSSKVVERMILAATEKLKKTAWAKIYIATSPDMKTDVQGDPEFLRELSNLSDNVKIIVMDGEEPGTCIIEMPDEIMDVSVGTQLENIKDIMNNARL